MTRVLVISQLPPPVHGSTVMTKTFLEMLDGLGYDWKLIDRRFSATVAEVGKLRLRKVASAARMPFRLIRAMRAFKPEVVVFFATNRTFSFLVDWVLSEILRWFPVRCINYLHTVGFEALSNRNLVLAGLVGRLLSSADTTVCLGPTLAKDIVRWVDESRIVFIPNTVAGRPDDLGVREPDAPPLLLYLSNLIPEKGADTFVELAIRLAPELPNAAFVVAGASVDQGFTDSLRARVAASEQASQIHFRGAITDPHEKWCLLRDASILVFPSTYTFEAQPLTILEALSMGTPVVAYDVGGIKDILQGYAGCHVVQARNTLLLEEAVRAVLKMSDNRVAELDLLDNYASGWSKTLVDIPSSRLPDGRI